MEISRICTGSPMLSGPAEIPAKHFCKKSGNKLACDFLVGNVRFGSKADMCGATAYVRFGPRADISVEARPQKLLASLVGIPFSHLRA